MPTDDVREWEATLTQTVVELPVTIVDRVKVVPEVQSTQDAAFRESAGRPGLCLLAMRQTAGRGRLGRVWHAAPDLSIAVTFVLDAARFKAQHVSLAAGVAVANTLDGRAPGIERFGLRWPNDVVEPNHPRGGGRKIAGVLIEVRDGLALVGIGINVLQQEPDFPPELRGKAVSLRQLGSTASRLKIADGLLQEMHWELATEPRKLAREWTARDALTGSSHAFDHDGRRYAGIVLSIDPTSEIVLQIGPDKVVRLPAATTSLVKD